MNPSSDSDQKNALPLWLKKATPEFIMEILPEEEEQEILNKSNKTVSPVTKLVLFGKIKHEVSVASNAEEESSFNGTRNYTSIAGCNADINHSTPVAVLCENDQSDVKLGNSPSPVKKLKFLETSLQHETGKRKIASKEDSSNTFKLSRSLNDGNATTAFRDPINSSAFIVSRPPKSKSSNLVSAPKRFKLV